MIKTRLLSLALAVAMIATMFTGVVVFAADDAQAADAVTVDFTKLTEVPVYTAEKTSGFVSTSGAIMAEGYDRVVAGTDKITIGADGASVTESDGEYLSSKYKGSSSYANYGGLIYRQDVEPGAYHIEVTLGGDSTSSNTKIAPTGMDSSRLTSSNPWDTAGHVARTAIAKWDETATTWSYDFATGDKFVELDIEPTTLPTAEKPQTVTVKSISITPIEKAAAGDKPTIHILGDSTQKTYTFNETISSWGQTLYKYFDTSKVNVVNYSMGGRCMRNNYTEGRFDDVLINGKEGDYVFLHSAHNDESPAETRFDRGCQYADKDTTKANALYNRWLYMYVDAIKARGMVPVLVSPMPRNAGGATTFNPDSPANMKKKAEADPDVAYIELYQGAVDYYKKLDKNEGTWTYNSVEAGETPANNSANGANGDGTHYREAAAKQFCRIMLQSIYDQSVAAEDTYTDKAIMENLVSYMPETVKTAAASENRDWSAVLPEQASDVDAVDVVPGATKQASDNYYYRTSIEKALQLGALHKDGENNFKPTQTITVGEFARGMEKVFNLPENSLTSYTKTYAELQAENPPADASEYVPVVSGPAEYAEAQADDGELIVTVQQAEGGTVTVYNNSAFDVHTTDIKGTEANNSVVDDNEYYTLTAPNTVTKGNRDGSYADNPEITNGSYVFRNNDDLYSYYEAKANGTITIYCFAAHNKQIGIENVEDSSDKHEVYINDVLESGDSNSEAGTVHFTVEAGKKYKMYTRGGTGYLFGIKFEGDNYPQSTTSLSASAGDEIRVSAIAGDGYLNDKILVNGQPVDSSGREYTFKLEADTTVSATYRSEPAFADSTLIASDAALTREAMGAILYDAYLAAYGKKEDGSWNKVEYMNQKGSIPAPGDPGYDPNIKYEGATYNPLTGWAALKDISDIDPSLYGKVKEAYNLGLIRTEKGIARGVIINGDELEPKAEVTRAKAAKALVFCFILTQEPNEESQIIPDEHNYAAETVADIIAPNPDAPSTPYIGGATPTTPPTTEAPATEPPATTEAPASEPPATTEAPASESPATTEAPASEPPATTEAPASEPPATTEAPATEPPAMTEAPASEPPATTEAPASEAPSTKEPEGSSAPTETSEPTSAPTRRPSSGGGGGGGYTNSSFNTGATTSTAAPNPTATAAPAASGMPEATVKPDTTVTAPGPATGEVQMPFTDVAATDWYYPYVQNVYSMGIMNGESDTLFGPGDTLTRGMLVTILGRFDKADTSAASSFADVDANEYYAPYIAWAAESGIVDGVGDNMFAPNDAVTREQAAKIITGYYTYKGQGPTGAWAIQLEYTDLGQISDWAVEGVMYCTMKQVMTGNDVGAFEPQSPITRAEFAAVMSRI